MEKNNKNSSFLYIKNYITYWLFFYYVFVIKYSSGISLKPENHITNVNYYYDKTLYKTNFIRERRNKLPLLFLKKRNRHTNSLSSINAVTLKDIDLKKEKGENRRPWNEVKEIRHSSDPQHESKDEKFSRTEIERKKEKNETQFLKSRLKNENQNANKEEAVGDLSKQSVALLDDEELAYLKGRSDNDIIKKIVSKFWNSNKGKREGKRKEKEKEDETGNNKGGGKENRNINDDEPENDKEEIKDKEEWETEENWNDNNDNEKVEERKEDPETNFLLKSLESGKFPNFCIVENVDEHADNFDIYISKEKMNELKISEGFTVLLKGKKKRQMLGIARLNKNIKKSFVVISSSMKKNLRVGHNDIIKLYPFLKMKKIKKVTVSPFSDTAENMSKEEMANTIIKPYFLKHKYCPLSVNDSIFIAFKNRKVEVKILKIETDENENENENEIKQENEGEEGSNGFISSDTEIVLAEEYLNREDFEENSDDITYEDLGGMKKQLNKIRELIELPLKYPEIFVSIGISAPKGVLMHGIPGTGKTSIAKAIANESNAYCYIINGPEIMSKHIGESEQKLRKIFKKASEKTPCIIFIDEIDSIANKRSKSNNELEKRVVSQLLTLMDGLKKNNNVLVLGATNRPNAIDPALRRFGRFDREIEIPVPDEEGRYEILLTKTKKMKLDKDVNLRKIAKECHGYVGADLAQLCFEAAIQCIKEHIHCLDLEEEDFIEFMKISMISEEEEKKNRELEQEKEQEKKQGHGQEQRMELKLKLKDSKYGSEVLKNGGEDVYANTSNNKSSTLNKISAHKRFFNLRKREENNERILADNLKKAEGGKDKLDNAQRKIPAYILNKLTIKARHFQHALNICNPSSLRERQVQIPTVTWKDIGGMNEVKEQLKETILYPLEYKNLYNKFNSNYNKGILLYGPPGCGKTLLAKAIANECKANFISVKGPELLTMWFGESEANVRDLFDKARAASPCIIFFDEIDSLAKERNSNNNNDASDRVINQILTEIDGINEKKTIFIIAATNRPDILDKALTRPGRLDKLIYISLPDYKSRYSIFKAILKNTPLSKDVNIHEMAKKTEGFSGADITNLCQSAVNEAIKETIHLLKRRKAKEKNEKNGKSRKGSKNCEKNETDEYDPVPCLAKKHFDLAFKNARISIQPEDVIKYENFKKKLTL